MYDIYYIAIIIITLIAYIILIGLAIYFMYLPAVRIDGIFSDVIVNGNEFIDLLDNVEDQVELTNAEVQAIAVGFCNFNEDLTEAEKEAFWGNTFDDFCENLDVEIPTSCP